jgi:hypothetical protein
LYSLVFSEWLARVGGQRTGTLMLGEDVLAGMLWHENKES